MVTTDVSVDIWYGSKDNISKELYPFYYLKNFKVFLFKFGVDFDKEK